MFEVSEGTFINEKYVTKAYVDFDEYYDKYCIYFKLIDIDCCFIYNETFDVKERACARLREIVGCKTH